MSTIISNLITTDVNLLELAIDDPIGVDDSPLLIANTTTDNSLNDIADTEMPAKHTLQTTDFYVDWQTRLDENQLDQLANEGWIIIDNVFADKALLALQSESGFIDYRDAQLTAGIRLSAIRGDKIRWINKDFFAGSYYLESINELSTMLNRSLFAGIRHSEAHYACYPIGFGYQWHSDNPAGRDERVISAVFYLNDDWQAANGGALEIVDNQGNYHTIMPVANRLIVFDSDLQHQVQIAHRQRYSIATWMRRDNSIPFIDDNS